MPEKQHLFPIAEEDPGETGQSPPWTQDAARLADLFTQTMSKTLSRRLLAEVPEALALEVTLPQMHALRYLWLHEKVLMGDLAEGLDISHPSATNMVKRLMEKGLVRRTGNPVDRREVEVALTECGKTLTERVEQERIRRLAQLLERMGESNRMALLHGLKQFLLLTVNEDPCAAEEICLRCGWRASTNCPLAEIIPLFACR